MWITKKEKSRHPYSSSCTLELSENLDAPRASAVETGRVPSAWEAPRCERASIRDHDSEMRGARAVPLDPVFATHRRSRRAALADALDAWLTLLGWRSRRGGTR